MVNKPSEFNIHRKVESKPKPINIPCLTNSKFEITSADSLNIQTCINYWELVTVNFELKVLVNFLDISRKIIKVKGKSACCFGSKFVFIIGAYFIPILVLKFQLKSSVKTSAKTRGFLSLFIFLFFYSTLEPFWFLFEF